MSQIENESLVNSRILNSIRTAVVSLLQIATATFFPFIIRTEMIYVLGDKIAGVNTVFVSIISIINMLELGFSGVVGYFLYEALANGDDIKVGAFLCFVRKIYRNIGIVSLIIGLVIMMFFPIVFNEEIDIRLLNVCYLIILISTIIPYFIGAEITTFFTAYQRGYYISFASIVGLIVSFLAQIIAIKVFKSFLLYCVGVFIQVLVVISFQLLLKKLKMPHFEYDDILQKKEKKEIQYKVVAVFGHQMDEKFIMSIDSIVISAFVGLSAVNIYGNYMYVITAFIMFLQAIIKSSTASIGNSLVTESISSNYNRFKAVFWLNGVLTIWITGCILTLYQPFMKAWMHYRLFPIHTVFLFCMYFFVAQIRLAVLTFKNANGMWEEDRYKPYVSMIVNLTLDIVLVMLIGVDGALLSSIICIALIEIPWEGKVLYRFFGIPTSTYIKKVCLFFVLGFVLCASNYILCSHLFGDEGIRFLVMKGVFSFLFMGTTLFVIFLKSQEMEVWAGTLKLYLQQKNKS